MPARPGRSLDNRQSPNHQSLRGRISRLLGGGTKSGLKAPADAKRGRLLLESLEQRQLMAGDMDLLFTDANPAANPATLSNDSSNTLQVASAAEGEAAPDLVQFARDLAAAGVDFYGADWCPACTQQKELFSDGRDDLPFIEVTNPDQTFNSIATSQGITQIPTWDFPSGQRLTGVQTLEALSTASGVPIPVSDQPSIDPIGDLTVRTGSPLHVPIDAYDPGDGPLTTTVTVADPSLLTATVLTGNRSLRLDLAGYGDMVFELFEQRAPRAAGRVADLADEGFYDGIIFHRVVDDFVIQAGDPTGTGTGGSTRGDFDDDFHPDLQHNTEGVLSFAKSSDDTNDSQFFITEVPTRFLDFNHSVFGQLVEGFDVREAISETEVDNSSSNRPTNTVTIDSASIFNDTENSVVMLRPVGNATGTTTVTFTVTDADGNTFSETVTVTVEADNANSQPFLNEITNPAAVAAGQTAQLQLSSIDVEGDAVTYFASTSSTNVSASVDATTGLVTVTPVDGFTGTANVNVGVRPGPGVTGNGSGDSDNQSVPFVFETQTTTTAPTSVDLLATSDTGSSNTDNITNAGSLSFLVSGVVDGQTVELVDTNTGSVIGTGNATGQTITITTNNIATLGDGTYPIAARSAVGNDVSNLSPSIAVTYDDTQPASVISSAARTGNVGRAFVTDLISVEEGSGLVYSFTAAPTGATIDATSGVIQWTPTAAQLGSNSFTLSLTDAAGNTRTETFDVAVAGTPLAEIRLELTDLQGNSISSVGVGDEFLLNFIGVDARRFTQPGVFAAYADILFDSNLIQPVPGSSIEFDPDFSVVPKGTFSPGLIDELGAVINRSVATNESVNPIATVRMQALAEGTVNIISEPADESNSETLLFGVDERISADSVAYGVATLAIGQSFTVGNDTFTVAEDSGSTAIDVLANDSIVTGGGSLSVVSVTQPSSGGTVSLAGGAVNFTPDADFFGAAAFTYQARSTSGAVQTASVTVTVTPVNDPPTGVADTVTVDENSSANILDVLANDSISPDTGETLTITAVGSSTAGGTVTIQSGGERVIYTPAAGFVGNDTFTYTVSDGTLTSEVTATVTVITADNPPTAVDDAFSITEDAAEAAFDVLGNDTRDTDNEAFTLTAIGSTSAGGNARISSDGTQFFYTPAANFSGTEEVTYTIQDTGGGASIGTVTFTVTAVNDPPPASDISFQSNRGAGEQVVVTLANQVNVDLGETLTFSAFDSATTAGGTVRQDTASGTLFYSPPSADFTGSDSFTYTVADGSGLTTTGTVTIDVTDFIARTISYNLSVNPSSLSASSFRLVGTDALGAAVDVAATANGSSLDFADVLPGNYSIEVPAIPFLQNGSEPRSIAVNSLPDDGDASIQSDLGRLRPEFISIRDFLRSTPRQSILVAVADGQSGIMTTPTSAVSTIESPVVELDSTGANLTIRGTRTIAADGTTPASTEDVQASIATSGNSAVQQRGEVDGLKLFRINVEPAAVTFSNQSVTTSTSNTSSSPTVAAVSTQSSISTGSTAAEGESFAASSAVQADVFSPAPSQATAAEIQRTLDPESTIDSEPAANLTSAESPNDVAMQSVADELTIQSSTEDTIAQPRSLSEDNVDGLLSL
ncbi:putative peptidyl-prolyl cis-trans isomerase [Rubripirellula obstinata]|uniref:peptidylprolyl isomerase n=1 Tax=Rubripirellula obstinata TaxID=406547 RepID=A0A5B1CG28_9BACT|nr:tandem-95 repeat protein [Rubripirellula obstinata]KAA1259161.1 putative peptidyl-prolyl cis-trans isomerase [Rubripirellula obstinata]